jgi:hypothetical protein
VADPRQARENRAYVRRLLWGKQPGFAAALEAVVLQAQLGPDHPATLATRNTLARWEEQQATRDTHG